MERAKQRAVLILKSLGLTTESIPVSDEKRADLYGWDGTHQYVVEVKQRFDDPKERQEATDKMATGEAYDSTEPHSFSNPLDRVMRYGLKQIDKTPKDDLSFNLLWLNAEGMDADLKMRRARNTFYGLVPVGPKWPHKGDVVNCFYFDYSTCRRLPNVHGLVLDDGDGVQLCLNEFSPSLDRFRKSILVERLGAAVVDPVKLAATGEAIALKSGIARKNEERVLAELERETGKRFFAIRLKRHASSYMVPRGE